MKHAVKLLTAGVALAAVSVPAFAADLAEPQIIETPIYQAPEHVPHKMSGWYIRGDVGYSWNDVHDITYSTYATDPLTGTLTINDENSLTGDMKGSFSLGAGVGYQLNHWARVDATLDYDFNSDFDGSTVTTTCNPAIVGAASCVSSDSATFSALTVMANAYVDLGTYSGFTPYVGAGIGGARVKWGDLSNTECDAADPTNCAPTVVHEGSTDWRFAYALMAGVSYDVNHKLSIDLGYRYKKIQGGHMFGYAGFTGPGVDDGISQHQIRAGLRYKFGGGAKHKPMQQASYHPAPVYK